MLKRVVERNRWKQKRYPSDLFRTSNEKGILPTYLLGDQASFKEKLYSLHEFPFNHKILDGNVRNYRQNI